MTDHLDEAAAKAIELATILTTPTDLDDTLRVGAAQHLTYLAGLIRGGAVRPTWNGTTVLPPRAEPFVVKSWQVDDLPVDPDKLNRIEDAVTGEVAADGLPAKTTDPREAARNFRASAAKLGGGSPFYGGVRHGYLMAADVLDEVADVVPTPAEHAELRRRWREAVSQRDDLLAAAKKVLADKDPVLTGLIDTVAHIEAES